MIRLRVPLYGKILLWFLVNLAVLGLLGTLFMRTQFRLGFDWMLAGPGGERLEQLGESLTDELRRTPESDWPAVLERQEAALGLTLALFGSDGIQQLGPPLEVPDELRSKLIDKRRTEDMPPPPRPDDARNRGREREREPKPGRDQPPKPRFMMRSSDPARYWAGIHLALAHGEASARRPLTLVIVSDSLSGGGFFFNPWPWAGLVAGGLLVSALIWLPMVGRITRAIRRTNDASRRIADGDFGTRLPEGRHDELGELASSVNAMAGQLGAYVAEQRRITADVAHELCSPIARMQMALGVIEQRGTPEQAAYLGKLDTELQHMAKLVEEVLAFSKAETLPDRDSPETFLLVDLVHSVLSREADGADLRVEIPVELRLHSFRAALDRALGNVVRNAVRYAGQAGPIRIEASTEDGRVFIRVIDCGPGVPEEALPRLFDPFFRPEGARGRQSGGSGLGLAISRRCIEACEGSISVVRNHPNGLKVTVVLPASVVTG